MKTRSFPFVCVVAGWLALSPLWAGFVRGDDKASAVQASFKLEIPADDKALGQDIKDGRFTKWSFDEAALLASGVADATQRKGYLERLNLLEKQAREALGNSEKPLEKGERLLVWLHGKARPLKKYAAKQTDLSVLLDSGNYNCVSSAVLYNVLGRRLGLDLRAIEVSDHAFSILYDGKQHVDVETTSPRGFNPLRDKKAAEELKGITGFNYIPERHKDQRREIGETGLVAAIYFNHAVLAFQQKRYQPAFVASICAMRLDADAFAAKEALAALARWTGELARKGELDTALQVLDQAGDLIQNPDAVHKMILIVFDTIAKDLTKKKDWQAAVDLYAKGLERHPGDKHLNQNARATWDGWAKAFMKNKEWDDAIEVYQRALKRFPADKVFTNNIKYCEQQKKKSVMK